MEPLRTPKTRVDATDTGLVIEVEVGKIRREDLEVTVEEATVGGQRIRVCGSPGDRDSFESIVVVPFLYDSRRAEAKYQSGILRIYVPDVTAS